MKKLITILAIITLISVPVIVSAGFWDWLKPLFGQEISLGGTKVFPYQGGTGQDSSAWTGVAQISSGTWSADNDLSVTTITATAVTTTDLYASILTVGAVAKGDVDLQNHRIWSIGTASSTFNASGGLIVQSSSTFTGTLDIVATTTSGTLAIGTNKLYVGENGYVGIGTTTPRYLLDVWGSLAIGTSTSPIFLADTGVTGTMGITVGADISMGSMQVASSSGAVTILDMQVEASASAGTEESYCFTVDSTSTCSVLMYAESDGVGGIRNQRVGIATTTPQVRLDIKGEMRAIQNVTSTCNNLLEGMIFFNQVDKRFVGCNGTSWVYLDI